MATRAAAWHTLGIQVLEKVAIFGRRYVNEVPQSGESDRYLGKVARCVAMRESGREEKDGQIAMPSSKLLATPKGDSIGLIGQQPGSDSVAMLLRLAFSLVQLDRTIGVTKGFGQTSQVVACCGDPIGQL